MSSRERGLILIEELRAANRITSVEADALRDAFGSEHAQIDDADFVSEAFSSEWLIALRSAKGFTQEDVADMVGVSRAALGAWETGRSKPSVRNAKLLRDALLRNDEIKEMQIHFSAPDGDSCGARLAKLRRLCGMTQQQLADATGGHLITMNKLERGKAKMTYEWASKLASALGAKVSDILPEVM